MQDFGYAAVEGWAKLPDGWSIGEVAAVTVDRHDNVYVFQRTEHPLIVFDRDGNYLRSWGEGLFNWPHGLSIGPDDTLYTTDRWDHCVRQFTLDGRLLQTIGVPGRASGFNSGQPFNQCTHTALAPNGDLYISDGYGNSRVHRYTPDGRYLESWGAPGTGPGEFCFPHNIVCDAEGWVYVADRENHRVQVFDGDGRYETEWHNLHRPSALYLAPGPDQSFYIGEVGPYLKVNRAWPNLGPRISVMSNTGELRARFDSPVREEGIGAGRFLSPHSIAVDSRGAIYLGDVCNTAWPSLFPEEPMPEGMTGLHVFTTTTRGL